MLPSRNCLTMNFGRRNDEVRSKQASSIGQMFSSHPDTASRVERVAEKAQAEGYTKPGTTGSSSSSSSNSSATPVNSSTTAKTSEYLHF